MRFTIFRIEVAIVGLCVSALLSEGNSQEVRPPEPDKSRDVVLVNVTVTDPVNRIVEGLQKNHFRLYENKTAKVITYFAHQEIPLSFAIVCDLSEAAETTRKETDVAIRSFLQSANSSDEFFLVLFNDKSALVKSISYQRSATEKVGYFNQIAGLSALDQAVLVGLKMVKNDCDKKALVVVTAASKMEIDMAYRTWQLEKQPRLQVYTIQKHGWEMETVKPYGRTFVVDDIDDVGYYLNLAYVELRNQYVLGYSPSNKKGPAVAPKISVKLNPPQGFPKLTARIANDYSTPKR